MIRLTNIVSKYKKKPVNWPFLIYLFWYADLKWQFKWHYIISFILQEYPEYHEYWYDDLYEIINNFF